ncbi:MAG: hypothetical protein H8Z69_03425 [Nanohaloarchaea archaeon]|nr:hypothetical protein [Candidatus Nanohaloarchaea archaeon]
MKKGISPIISAVVLIAFLMTVAGLAGPYFTDVFENTSDEATNQQEDLVESSKGELEIKEMSYDSGKGSYMVEIKNTGTTNIKNLTITITGDKPVQKRASSSLAPGEIRQISVSSTSREGELQITSADANMDIYRDLNQTS